MIGANEHTISTAHGTTISTSSNKALLDHALEHLRARGWKVSGSTVDIAGRDEIERVRHDIWQAWASFTPAS